MYAIYGNMDPINIPQMLPYIPYMDPMGMKIPATFAKQLPSQAMTCLVESSLPNQ